MAQEHDHGNLGGSRSNRVWSTERAADYLDVSPDSLRHYHRTWGIPSFRLGKELRFRERDLHAWVERKLAEDAGRRARAS